jgi:hypothetical protein
LQIFHSFSFPIGDYVASHSVSRTLRRAITGRKVTELLIANRVSLDNSTIL